MYAFAVAHLTKGCFSEYKNEGVKQSQMTMTGAEVKVSSDGNEEIEQKSWLVFSANII